MVGLRDEHRPFEAGALGDGDEVDAVAGVGFLHAGLAVVLVILDEDGEVFGMFDGDGGEAAEAHEHFAVAGDDEDFSGWLGEGEAEADHGGAAHAAPEGKVFRAVAGCGDVPGRGAEPGDDEHVAAVGEDGAAEVAPVEFGHGDQSLPKVLAPRRRWPRRVAVGRKVLKAMRSAASTVGGDVGGVVGAEDEGSHGLEDGLGGGSHGDLRRVELAEVAAHRDDHGHGGAVDGGEGEHVDAVSDAGALHEEDALVAAEPGAGEEGDAFFFGGEGDDLHGVVGQAAFDQAGVAGVRDEGDLADGVGFQEVEDLVGPGGFDVMSGWWRHRFPLGAFFVALVGEARGGGVSIQFGDVR